MESTITALIGLGTWGRRIAPQIDRHTTLSAVAHQGDPGTVEWAAQNGLAARLTADLEAVLTDPQIELVIIATPSPSHAGLVYRALESGKHVLCEKPLAADAPEIRRLGRLADQHGLVLAESHPFLYHPPWDAMKTRIDGDRIVRSHSTWLKFGTFTTPLVDNLMIHDLGLLLDLYGETRWSCAEAIRSGMVTDGDLFLTVLQNDMGSQHWAYIDRTSRLRHKSFSVMSESGRAWVWDATGLHETRDGETHEVSLGQQEDPYIRQLAAVEKAIDIRSPLRNDWRFAARVAELRSEVTREAQGHAPAMPPTAPGAQVRGGARP